MKTNALFVVGMPRSGTKLLRSLLNRHTQIRIPDIETEFLPYWVEHWQAYGDLSQWNCFAEFYQSQMQVPFFIYAKERGCLPDAEGWYGQCKRFDAAGVFEALMRCMAEIEPGQSDIIWGDKSPSYIRHVPLVLSLYPQAKCIHIVRDVRDYCISIHAAWGKNMLRAAQRWRDSVEEIHAVAESVPLRVLEVRYEDLLENTGQVMVTIAGFLGVKFDAVMLEPEGVTENIGSTKGKAGVVKGNQAKYLSAMNPKLQFKLESVSRDMLAAYGYPVAAGDLQRVPSWKMKGLQVLDGVNLVRFEARERGLVNGLRFHLSYFKTSGNKRAGVEK